MSESIYEALARDYLQKFPFDSVFYTEEFDKWAWSINSPYRLPRLRGAYTAANPEWGGHLDRRHTMKKRINIGGRSLERDQQFQILVEKANTWSTYRLIEATTNGTRALHVRVNKVVDTKFRNITKLIRSADFDLLTNETRSLFRRFRRHLKQSGDHIVFLCDQLDDTANDAIDEAKAEVATKIRGGYSVGELEFLFTQDELDRLRAGRMRDA